MGRGGGDDVVGEEKALTKFMKFPFLGNWKFVILKQIRRLFSKHTSTSEHYDSVTFKTFEKSIFNYLAFKLT